MLILREYIANELCLKVRQVPCFDFCVIIDQDQGCLLRLEVLSLHVRVDFWSLTFDQVDKSILMPREGVVTDRVLTDGDVYTRRLSFLLLELHRRHHLIVNELVERYLRVNVRRAYLVF